MASTSASSSIQKSFKYDVFISFRGEDTRKNFVDHLYHALRHKSILTYKDDERITKGKRISDELITAIQDSRFYVIVFSKNYASSSWCLDELVQIMEECHKTTFHTAYPVFYDVEPTEVRKQSGSVREAFSKHHEKQDDDAAKWREALKEAADLAGWELKNTLDGHEAKFIQKILETISLDLRFVDSSVDDGKLIGMESRINGIVSALEIASDDVRMIGIKGMGGAGKTTLARAVYDRISFKFEKKIFVENVREVSKASLSGLRKLQKQILSDVLNDEHIKVHSVHDGINMMKKMMRSRKVDEKDVLKLLLVLDDVDNTEQIEALAGKPNWFNPGSRIIITTREEQVLVSHRVNLICDVNLLSGDEAVCLFSRYAFGKEVPIHGYEELSRQVVRYAAGLPLTIRVLGSFLCGQNELEWKDAIDRLKTIPLRETLEKLELSYNGLEEDYKEILLDVACILKGCIKDEAVQVLESCGFHATNGLRVLRQKSLVTISEYGRLGMHDHIEEMGENIVRRLYPSEPNRHSRLWTQEEIEHILANDSGTEATTCIQMEMPRDHRLETFIKGLGNMKKLRLLVIFGSEDGINAREVLGECLPNSLRYLRWNFYPFKSLMKSFQEDHLVGLSLTYSEIQQFWKYGERKVLKKLKFLDMTGSYIRTLDLEMIPNIEMLNLEGCRHLVELNMPFECSKLKVLNLKHCKKLSTLKLVPAPDLETLSLAGCHDLLELHMPFRYPKLKALRLNSSKLMTLNMGQTSDLETLVLKECRDLVEFHMPNECPKLKCLWLRNSALRNLSLRLTQDLETLWLEECHDLLELHMPFRCPKLIDLILNCSKLRTPLNLGWTPDLETLSLEGCHDLLELRMPFECSKLKALNLQDCKILRTLKLAPTPDLETLGLGGCHDLLELHMPYRYPKLRSLHLNCSKLRTLNMGQTSDLKTLVLKKCHNLVEFHMPNDLENLVLEECRGLVEFHMPNECPKLKCLWLMNSALRNLSLGLTPDLETLRLEECHDLLELHMPFGCPKLKSLVISNTKLRTLDLSQTPNLERLDLKKCFDLVGLDSRIGCLEKLVYLDLSDCWGFKCFLFDKKIQSAEVVSLHLIAESIDICPLHPDSNLQKFRFSCLYEEPIPSSYGNLGKLISIGICACTNLESFSRSICDLQCLRKLALGGSISEVPKDLDRLACLEELYILNTNNIKHLPDSICTLKHLKTLELKSCLLLEKLPEDLGQIECLERLSLNECILLRDIPNSICKMTRLRQFCLCYCVGVDKLPEELGSLECLEELNIAGTSIMRLPESIFSLKGLRIIASAETSEYGVMYI